MTIDEARTWLQCHADNTPMPGAREAYRTMQLLEFENASKRLGTVWMELFRATSCYPLDATTGTADGRMTTNM